LCVVTKNVARHIEKTYGYYMKKDFKYLQFIPCLDELGSDPGKNPYSLTPQSYEEFLKKLFDLWYRDLMKGKYISIRNFDNILHMLLGRPPEACDMMGKCSCNPVIEADGSVYPCDFYVLNQWKLGDIFNRTLQEMINGETAKSFIEVSAVTPQLCKDCEYSRICRGGCRRHYESIGHSKLENNYFCTSYKGFYQYTLPRFYEAARILSRGRS